VAQYASNVPAPSVASIRSYRSSAMRGGYAPTAGAQLLRS
jgi:hypothetical protein